MKYDTVKYDFKDDAIVFWCTAVDRNEQAASALNDFILRLSKNKKVFLHSYRLPEESTSEMFDPSVVLEKTKTLLDPFHTFFYLSEARVNIKGFDWASASTIYYFEPAVEWTDFLATSVIHESAKFIKKGLLSAEFSVLDQGADYWFKSNPCYERKVLKLFKGLSDSGYKIQQSSCLSI